MSERRLGLVGVAVGDRLVGLQDDVEDVAGVFGRQDRRQALHQMTQLAQDLRDLFCQDNIDLDAATHKGILVMNTPDANTLSTAEHAFTLMLALSRRVAEAYAKLCQGKWDRKTFMGTQLADKTLGIVGLGRIGQEVARRALAFQMRVLGYDPFLSAEQAAKLGITRVATVREMLPQIDYLTVHTPLTPETTNLIDAEAIGTSSNRA